MLLLVLPMTIGTNLVFGETRFRLPLHLLRCTTCSFGPAHDNVMHAPKRTLWNSVAVRLLPPAGLSRRGLLMIGRAVLVCPLTVEPRRLELLTSSLQRRRSTS